MFQDIAASSQYVKLRTSEQGNDLNDIVEHVCLEFNTAACHMDVSESLA
jgi:hypothetical protein